MFVVESPKENLLKLSKKVRSLVDGKKINKVNMFIRTYNSKIKTGSNRHIISIREDGNDGFYKLSQISLSTEELIQLRDCINDIIEKK